MKVWIITNSSDIDVDSITVTDTELLADLLVGERRKTHGTSPQVIECEVEGWSRR